MSNQYTLGPWVVEDRPSLSGRNSTVKAHSDEVIAVNLTLPNARLIAAAPDLLAVLERIENYLDRGGKIEQCSEIHFDWIRAAIAKVKGE
ncbi:MAG: hypothetical protein EG826_17850 [Deltaproteobacteria bacterium]|nr:hypothetical protein [Deltaproteobacteria bacterium]